MRRKEYDKIMAKKRPGLGKGLEALIPSQTPQEDASIASGVTQVPLDEIAANPHQPRKSFDHTQLQELADSIKEHGVIQPLIITAEEDTGGKPYALIAGERRLKAARLAGLETVPAILRETSSQDQLVVALIENVQRADLNPLETAAAYANLSEEFDLTHQEIGERVGKSRTTVTNTLRLLELPDVVQQALRKGQISSGHARALLTLETVPSQTAALQSVLTGDLNVRQTESLVKRLRGQKNQVPAKPKPESPELKALEEELRNSLGTKVSLKQTGSGKGSLTIHFYSDEELNALLDKILGD